MLNIYILNTKQFGLLYYNLFSEVLEYTHGIFHAEVLFMFLNVLLHNNLNTKDFDKNIFYLLITKNN